MGSYFAVRHLTLPQNATVLRDINSSIHSFGGVLSRWCGGFLMLFFALFSIVRDRACFFFSVLLFPQFYSRCQKRCHRAEFRSLVRSPNVFFFRYQVFAGVSARAAVFLISGRQPAIPCGPCIWHCYRDTVGRSFSLQGLSSPFYFTRFFSPPEKTLLAALPSF